MSTSKATPQAKSYAAMTALVVEPVESMRATVAKMVSEMGFANVIGASNGEHALSLLRSEDVDLVLSELLMPKMNGIQLLQHVRNGKRNFSVPFVMISANIEQSQVVQAIKQGVSEYVVKPFSAKILHARIERALVNPVKRTSAVAEKVDKLNDALVEAEPLRILVVDDVVDNIQLISDILRKEYKVRAATSGETALKICSSDPLPDLILLDVMMPDMDGFEVCRRLKLNPFTQHIAIIFLTALDQTDDMLKGFELGAVDYITKPINPPVLHARVRTHMTLTAQLREMRNMLDTMQDNVLLKEELEQLKQSRN
ncbi:hypothetical protein GCM10009092_23060 [Bowmanella denitrificans]|uniref:Response regulatory domain-containing protein n=1 Tax=Bowmanella denitrificans TaxID=366582 RepID=A0ABN0X9X0_9ALTE